MIGHHIFNGSPLFPASGFLEMMYAAAHHISDGSPVALENIEIFSGLFLGSEEQSIQFRIEHSLVGNRIEIWSRLDGRSERWTRNCLCTIATPRRLFPGGTWEMIEHFMDRETQSYPGDLIYQIFAIGQFEYKQQLRMIQEYRRTRNEIVATIDAGSINDQHHYTMHPSILDACLHACILSISIATSCSA